MNASVNKTGRLCQLISGVAALAHNGPASSFVLTDFSRYSERQLGPQAKALGQVVAARPCWRTGSGVTKQVRDLSVSKEKPLGAWCCSKASLLAFLLSCGTVTLLD
jgi:hypothetical protein